MSEASALPAHKRAKLVTDTAALVRAYGAAGKPFEEAVAHAALGHNALAHALDINGKFMHTFAHQIELETKKLLPSPDYAIPHDEAMRAAKNILANRVAEEQQMAALLRTPQFQLEIRNAQPSHGSNALPEGKIKEIAGRLVQEYDPNGPEGATHVIAGAVGQRLLHAALASCYAANGPLTAPLIEGLKEKMPNASPEQLLSIANGWLHDRYHPAKAVADAMKFDGDAYQQAAKRADDIQFGAAPAKQGFAERVRLKSGAQEIVMDGL